jgi:hypothetical protein
MTLLVVLFLGAGFVLIASSIETDKATGKSVSIIQTIKDIWTNNVDFSQPTWSGGGGGFNPCGAPPDPKNYRFGDKDPQYLLDYGIWAQCVSTFKPGSGPAPAGAPNNGTPPGGTPPGGVPMSAQFVGTAHPSFWGDQAGYRQSIVKAWVQSKLDGTI